MSIEFYLCGIVEIFLRYVLQIYFSILCILINFLLQIFLISHLSAHCMFCKIHQLSRIIKKCPQCPVIIRREEKSPLNEPNIKANIWCKSLRALHSMYCRSWTSYFDYQEQIQECLLMDWSCSTESLKVAGRVVTIHYDFLTDRSCSSESVLLAGSLVTVYYVFLMWLRMIYLFWRPYRKVKQWNMDKSSWKLIWCFDSCGGFMSIRRE